jgi:hypothetical protein
LSSDGVEEVKALGRLDIESAKKIRKPGLSRALLARWPSKRVLERAPIRKPEPGYREAPAESGGSLSTPAVLAGARAAGLRFAGISVFWGLVGRIPREEWISDDGVVRMSSRRGQASAFEGAMSPYYLSTTFDDGTVVFTWGRPSPPLPSTERVLSRPGTGRLATDLAAHRRALAQYQGRVPDVRPVLVGSIDDCVALTRYFELNVATDRQVRTLWLLVLVRWGLRFALFALVVAVALLLWRSLG